MASLEGEHQELRQAAAQSEAHVADLQRKFIGAQEELQLEAHGLQEQVGGGAWGGVWGCGKGGGRAAARVAA